jgi:BirA family biotin operon repressor/biotin-[acetyl-CoA-carboxylase] ligase
VKKGNKFGIPSFEYELTDSTNEQAKIYAKSGSWQGEPTIFVANEQTKGRGRYSRRFYSKNGAGAYLSLLFKPNSDIKDTTAVIALSAISMIKSIESLSTTEVKIKWVNDLILGDKKLGGILIEGSVNPESGEYDYLIAGIGVNLYKTELDAEIKSIATSLEAQTGEKVDKDALICGFVRHFLEGLADLDSNTLFEDYKSRLVTLGKPVTVLTLTESYDATAIDLLPDYSLLVRTPKGEEKRIFTGEVSTKQIKN